MAGKEEATLLQVPGKLKGAEAATLKALLADRRGRPVGVVVGAGHPGPREERNLAAGFGPVRGRLPVVGLLHTQVESARAAELHDRYAPSSAEDYRRLDYAYWALGHVHARQRAVPELPVWYAGNLQGRHPGETGPKGGLLVEAEAGGHAEPEFVRFGPVRWERLAVELGPATDTAEGLLDLLVGQAARARGDLADEVAVRIELGGRSPLSARLRDPAERAQLEELVARSSGALEVQLRAGGLGPPADVAALRSEPTALARALELIGRAAGDDELLDELVPPALAGAGPGGRAARRAYLRELLPGLEDELVDRALEPEPE